MADQNPLRQPIAFLQQGKKETARRWLLRYLEEVNPQDAEAWILLARATSSPLEYRRALREALRADPQHVIARRLTIRLARQAVFEATGRDYVTEQNTRRRVRQILRIVGVMLLAVILFGGLLFSVVGVEPLREIIQTPTPRPDAQQICLQQAQTLQRELTFRCNGLAVGQACLANPPAQLVSGVITDDTLTAQTPLTDITRLETSSAQLPDLGLIVLRDEHWRGLLSGVATLTRVDDDFSNLRLSTESNGQACASALPGGLWLQSDQQVELRINRVLLRFAGTVWLTVEGDEWRATVLDGVAEAIWQTRRQPIAEAQVAILPVDAQGDPAGVFDLATLDDPVRDAFATYADALEFGNPWLVAPATVAAPAGTWQLLPSSLTSTLYGIDMANRNYGIAVGENSTVLTYDAGIWTRMDLSAVRAEWGGQRFSLFDVDIIGDEAWAVGEAGIVIHLQDGLWRLQSTPTDATLRAIDAGWAVGENGTILQLDTDGWQRYRLPLTATLNAVQMLSADAGWIFGDGGIVLFWDGDAWREQVFPAQADLLAGDGRRVLSSDSIFVRESGVWRQYPSAQPWSALSDRWLAGVAGLLGYDRGGGDIALFTLPTEATIHAVDGAWAVGEGGVLLNFIEDTE